MSGTTTSRRSMRACLPASRSAGDRRSTRRSAWRRCRAGRRRGVSAVAPARLGRHASCCPAWRWDWPSRSACSSRPAASTADAPRAARADRLRRADARHADPAAAVRPVLRPRRRHPPAGVRRRAARPRAELRRVRKRDLPLRRSRRCRSASSRPRATLGLSERQVLTLVRGPQAFRLALAPMTNDFVALLKDSSLVSVLTVVELTKQTQIFATNLGSWVIPGRCARHSICDVAAAGSARPPARAALEGADRMSDGRAPAATTSRLRRGARQILAGVDVRGRAASWSRSWDRRGRARRRILRAIAGLEPFDAGRIALGRRRSTAAPGRSADTLRRFAGRSAWCSSFTACSSTSRPSTTSASRPCTRTACRRRDAERRPRAADGVRRRTSGRRAAAGALRRRSAAGRDRPRAGRRSAGAADGRADGVARSASAAASSASCCCSLRAEGRTLVIATHDEEFARAWADADPCPSGRRHSSTRGTGRLVETATLTPKSKTRQPEGERPRQRRSDSRSARCCAADCRCSMRSFCWTDDWLG